MHLFAWVPQGPSRSVETPRCPSQKCPLLVAPKAPPRREALPPLTPGKAQHQQLPERIEHLLLQPDRLAPARTATRITVVVATERTATGLVTVQCSRCRSTPRRTPRWSIHQRRSMRIALEHRTCRLPIMARGKLPWLLNPNVPRLLPDRAVPRWLMPT